MTGPGGSASAMQQGGLGKGTMRPGRHSWTMPHLGQGQAALPRGPRAHHRPREVLGGPQPAARGRDKSQPHRWRHKWWGGECFFLLGPGAHPMVQK